MVTLASDITPEEMQIFLQDTDEQLQILDDDIIKLENDRENKELLQEIFRAAHTIKGSSAMLGYQKMAELTHAMESILDKLRKGTLTVTTQITDALLQGLDDLRILRNNLTAKKETAVNISKVISTLENLSSDDENTGSQTKGKKAKNQVSGITLSRQNRKRLQEELGQAHKAYQITVRIDPECDWAAVRCFQVLSDLESLGSAIIVSNPSKADIEAEKASFQMELICTGPMEAGDLRKTLETIPDIREAKIDAFDPSKIAMEDPQDYADEEISSDLTGKSVDAKSIQMGSIKVSETVRIDVESLDDLMNQIGELVVAHTRANQIGKLLESRYAHDTDVVALGTVFTHTTKVVEELQQNITQARMLPVGTVFTRLPRMVRDLAKQAGKKTDFIVQGQETGIDRSVIEHIRDPLVHLLRNAIDHGMESPKERKTAGKPEKGTIRLSAAHEQNYIVITVEDDGRGIDGALIKKAAVRKGIISADMASKLDDRDAIELIFEAGMSTTQKTTEVSGRGVGMDIVRKNVEAFNGIITVDTSVGQGTKFTLKLPLTLATINGLLITSNNMIYAIPLVSIIETLRIKPEEIETIRKREVIRLRDQIIPLLNLNDVLQVRREEDSETELAIIEAALGIGDYKNSHMIHVVVVKAGERMVGLIVDSLLEPQEVVVKSLGGFIGDIKGIAGASILGSGEVALILDVQSLVKLAIMGGDNLEKTRVHATI